MKSMQRILKIFYLKLLIYLFKNPLILDKYRYFSRIKGVYLQTHYSKRE